MEKPFESLRDLILEEERSRLDSLQSDFEGLAARLAALREGLAEQVVTSIEAASDADSASRLANALSGPVAQALGQAVHRDPGLVAQAIYPVVGPAVRRSIAESLRQVAYGIDQALNDALSLKALGWRLEAWRAGVPYAQIALRHQLRFKVEHLFLVQTRSGLLLEHQASVDSEAMDADAIAGMMTAVADFVKDSVAKSQSDSRLGSATVGEYRLLISEGPSARLAAFVSGVPEPDLMERLDQALEQWHAACARYGNRTGVHEARLEPGLLDALNGRADNALPPSGRTPFVMLGAALLLALLVGALGIWRDTVWRRESDALREDLDNRQGLVLLELDVSEKGRARVKGLLDPAADDPRAAIKKEHPGVDVSWDLSPYLSAEPAIAAKRLAAALNLPERSVLVDRQEVAHLAGEVAFPIWYSVKNTEPAVPGVSRIDASRLSFRNKETYDRLLSEIGELSFTFVRSAEPGSDSGLQLEVLSALAAQLQSLAARDGILAEFHVSGYTDEPGGLVVNRDLRLRRAEWLAAKLSPQLKKPSKVVVNLDVLSDFDLYGARRAAAVRVVLRPLVETQAVRVK